MLAATLCSLSHGKPRLRPTAEPQPPRRSGASTRPAVEPTTWPPATKPRPGPRRPGHCPLRSGTRSAPAHAGPHQHVQGRHSAAKDAARAAPAPPPVAGSTPPTPPTAPEPEPAARRSRPPTPTAPPRSPCAPSAVYQPGEGRSPTSPDPYPAALPTWGYKVGVRPLVLVRARTPGGEKTCRCWVDGLRWRCVRHSREASIRAPLGSKTADSIPCKTRIRGARASGRRVAYSGWAPEGLSQRERRAPAAEGP